MMDRSERLGMVLLWTTAMLVLVAFAALIGDVIVHGSSQLSFAFVTSTPTDAGRAGGIGPILVSTLSILAVCLITAVPTALAAAIVLAEFTTKNSRTGPFVRRSLDVLAGVPSIVFGLFGNALFVKVLGMGYSILSGGLTLACMALPILVRSIEVGFRGVPDDYRLGAAALGMSRTSVLRRILLPAAAPGIAVGLVLGIGRALAETAALIFTSGYVDRMPTSILDSGRALSVHIFDLSMNVPGGTANAYGSALVLLLLLLVINALASWFAHRWLGRGITIT